MARLVLLRAFADLSAAQFARSALRDAGFSVDLHSAESVGYQIMPVVSPYRLMIVETELPEARRVLATLETARPRTIVEDQEAGDDLVVDPSEVCPRCGSEDVKSWLVMIENFLDALRAPPGDGPAKENRECRACGKRWRAGSAADEHGAQI
jgi:DNA-directed RNA polymerase subunit M/transcription elongation factor TFIIS